jgi:hypothetical protein
MPRQRISEFHTHGSYHALRVCTKCTVVWGASWGVIIRFSVFSRAVYETKRTVEPSTVRLMMVCFTVFLGFMQSTTILDCIADVRLVPPPPPLTTLPPFTYIAIDVTIIPPLHLLLLLLPHLTWNPQQPSYTKRKTKQPTNFFVMNLLSLISTHLTPYSYPLHLTHLVHLATLHENSSSSSSSHHPPTPKPPMD